MSEGISKITTAELQEWFGKDMPWSALGVVNDESLDLEAKRAKLQEMGRVHKTQVKTYLGDGVYASFDGYQIWLAANSADNVVIAIEPGVLVELINFAGERGMINVRKAPGDAS